MTPSCDTCQLDFRPGEEADMETWERDGVARCRQCAREFAALRRLVDGEDFVRWAEPDTLWQALDDAMAHPLFVAIDARAPLYSAPGAALLLLTSTPGVGEDWFAERFIPGPVQIGRGYFPGGVTIHSRSRPHV